MEETLIKLIRELEERVERLEEARYNDFINRKTRKR